MPRPIKGSGLTEAVSKSLAKAFDLDDFRKSKRLDASVKFKDQEWYEFSPAMQEALSIPGFGKGHINLIRGHSDTGKTSALIEGAVAAQQRGDLVVFIITEMKWSWEHAREMGFQYEEVVDEVTGEVLDYRGNFLYVDRSTLHSIEDISAFMADMLNEQAKGKLPYDLTFCWDSIGSTPCELSIVQGKNNPMWNAGAMATQFGNFINQRITLSRKETSKYTNTIIAIQKVGIRPAENVMSQPKMTNKAGDAMYWDASIVITFGNVTNSGTSKIKAQKNNKEYEFAKRTKVCCDKNHINGIQSKTTVIVTVHGFIPDDKDAVAEYKKEHSNEWVQILGSATDVTITEDNSEWNEEKKISYINTDIETPNEE